MWPAETFKNLTSFRERRYCKVSTGSTLMAETGTRPIILIYNSSSFDSRIEVLFSPSRLKIKTLYFTYVIDKQRGYLYVSTEENFRP